MTRSLPAVFLLALGFASVAGATAKPAATVKTASVGTLGKVVVSATGRTLYHYTDEAKGQVKCTGSCATLWPPLVVKAGAKLVAGSGITASKLGVVKRAGGTLQVTYGGYGLYTYSGDTKAGEANGEALENEWYAVSPAAKIVKAAKATPSSSSGSTTTSSSSGGGYGY